LPPLLITGCIYDEETGEILPDGHITVSGTATVVILDDGSDGCYVIDVIAVGTVRIMVTPPFEYAFSSMCPPEGPQFDPSGGPSPPCQMMDPITCTLGVDPVGDELPDPTCASNPYFREFMIEDLDPQVFNNHFPLQPLDFPAPVLSPAGKFFLLMILLGVAALGLSRSNHMSAVRPPGQRPQPRGRSPVDR
jgi:hypothetical protein